jgi:hypothetical protein
MSSRKREAQQRAVEQQILQYKAVVEYLSKKSDPATLPPNNIRGISRVLLEGGWTPSDGAWCRGEHKLNIIEAGKIEFQEQYDRLRVAHLKRTIPGFKEG